MALNITTTGIPASVSDIVDPISDRVRVIFQYVNFVGLGTIIGLFGVFTNIFNIIVYKRLGFKESMHVSLLAISVSDLGSLLTLLWTCVCNNPAFIAAPVDIAPVEFQFLTGGVPHTRFVRITCWLTVLVTVERCLCLVTPMKVKTIFTPKSSTIAAIAIFVFFLSTQVFNILGNQLDWKFYKDENRSRIGIVPTSLLKHTRPIAVTMSIALQFLSMTAILVSNFTLLYFLRKKAAWRISMSRPQTGEQGGFVRGSAEAVPGINPQSKVTLRYFRGTTQDPMKPTGSTSSPTTSSPSSVAVVSQHQLSQFSYVRALVQGSGNSCPVVRSSGAKIIITTSSVPQDESVDNEEPRIINSSLAAAIRNRKLCRMILVLSAIMVLTYLPSTICLALSATFKHFSLGDKLNNSFVVAYSITFVFEATNSSVNIFLYYMMSTNYRRELKKIMKSFKKKNDRIGDVIQQRGVP